MDINIKGCQSLSQMASNIIFAVLLYKKKSYSVNIKTYAYLFCAYSTIYIFFVYVFHDTIRHISIQTIEIQISI